MKAGLGGQRFCPQSKRKPGPRHRPCRGLGRLHLWEKSEVFPNSEGVRLDDVGDSSKATGSSK